MKRAGEAARLEAAIYLKTGRVLMPGLALLIYLVTFYSVGPVDIVNSSVMTALILFLCMTWSGISYARSEEPVIAQLIQLKLNSPLLEIAARGLLIMAVSAAVSIFSAAWPLLKNAAAGGTFLSRSVSVTDAAEMLLLYLSSALAGGAFGAMFHPRVLRDTRAAWLLVLAGCLAGIFSGVIIRDIPVFAHIAPLFPPMYGLITGFDGVDYLHDGAFTRTVVSCFAYAAVAFTLKTVILRYRRF